MSENSQNFLTEENRQLLITLAREVLSVYLKDHQRITDPEDISSDLKEKMGVFVTLKRIEGGIEKSIISMGYPLPVKPLFVALIDSVIACATRARMQDLIDDPDSIILEISVLGRIEEIQAERRVNYPKQIKIGQDGIMVERDFQRALILPQVPVEHGWDEIDLLSETCLKAGLSPDAWLENDTRIYKFRAKIFR